VYGGCGVAIAEQDLEILKTESEQRFNDVNQ